MKTSFFLGRMIRYRPMLYAADVVLWIGIHATSLVPGLVVREFFNGLEASRGLDRGLSLVLAGLLGVALARILLIYSGALVDKLHRFSMSALLRQNMLAELLEKPGAAPLSCPAGAAINFFREDANQAEDSISWMIDVYGSACFTISSLVVLFGINASVTAFVFVPLIVVVVVAQRMEERVERYRTAKRKAEEELSSTLAHSLAGIQAVKVAGAEERMRRRFEKLSEARMDASLRDGLFNQLLNSIYRGVVKLGTGLILLLIALASDSGTFRLGDFALFIYCLNWISDYTTFWGSFLAHFQQTGVSFKRMEELLGEDSGEGLVRHRKMHIEKRLPPYARPARPRPSRLETLSAEGLSCLHPSGRGISGIGFELRRGELLAVTGRIGSGKTTLLRALQGLLPAEGRIRWNGLAVAEPKDFFAPPTSAYTPQVPGLFSDTLAENILLGEEADEGRLRAALRSAVLDRDIADFGKGLETLIGPRGVKLSGGQAQRTAAARMFLRDAELYLIDDMSSALDAETEELLWQRFRERKDMTCLAVSHRRATLKMADRVLVLKDGKVEAIGPLDELLESCGEMRELWAR